MYSNKMYQGYLNGDSWKCKDSPSGAHCWKEAIEFADSVFRCVHCGKERLLPKSFDSAMALMEKCPVNDISPLSVNGNMPAPVGFHKKARPIFDRAEQF